MSEINHYFYDFLTYKTVRTVVSEGKKFLL